MTWHKASLSSAVLLIGFLAAASGLGGCGSSSKNATIQITAPEKGQILTSKNDTDTGMSGLQFKVTAASTDVAPGTDVILRIEGEKEAPLTKVGNDGLIEFADVTLPRGKHTIQVTTGNSGIASPEDWDYTYKALLIENPMDGKVLGGSDDRDPDNAGIQINVSVKTFAIDMSEDVVLQVDKEPAGLPLHPNGSDSLMFTGVTLGNGDHTLKAVAGTVESDPVRISVNPTCANVMFVTPAVPSDGAALKLPGGDRCPAENQQYKQDFVVSTDAGDGRNVDLYVNGTPAANAKVEGTVVTFKDVVLDRFNTANEVEVVVETAQNTKCDPVKYPVDIKLDCAGVDCSISAPKPVAGNDAAGNRAQYLNRSLRNGDGFDFEVHTDMDALGRAVKLIIDGRETDAPTADPSGSDPDVKATFKGIKLDEGKHTIAARCEHGSGSVGISRTSTWIVDTQACGVDIQQPTADTLLVPGFDADGNLSGVQVDLEANLMGDDCRRARSATCDAASGIPDDVGYEDIDGESPLHSLVTLANEAQQTLCLDVLDRAGNKGSDNVAVRYLPEAPKLLIETPKNSTKFNAKGGTGYEKDSDTGSATVCNANFDVACSQLGSVVKLHRDDANGAVFAMANCEAKGNNDPALPIGYEGRARIKNAAFLSGTNDMVTVVATQGDGSNGQGESPAITLYGDCEVPDLKFMGDSPCGMGPIGVMDENSTVTKTVVVTDGTADTSKATLTVTSAGTTSTMLNANVSGNTYTFTNAALGGPGSGKRDITVAVTATDDFANDGRVSCDASIVFDLPVFTVMTPADNAVFRTTGTASPELCAPMGGSNGINIAATADVASNRSAAVSVNKGADIALTLNGTAITGCVPINPGSNELAFKLTSTRTTATTTVTRKVNLVTQDVPTTGITLNTPVLPADRTGKVKLTWTLPAEAYTGQFVKYELRCATQPFVMAQGESWWDAARVVTLPTDFKPPATTVDIDMRVGENANCQLRALDALGAAVQAPAKPDATSITPLTVSTSINVKFRTARLTATNPDQAMGVSVAGVGDVDGDGVSDLLVGGYGTSYLVFGLRDGSWTDSSRKVTFNGGSGTQMATNQSFLGIHVAGIGDFNGDSRPDFAIAETFHTGAPSQAGKVFVFFGRQASDAWPTMVDMTAPTGCAADICFEAVTVNALFGTSLGGVGDFDGDGRADLGVGAPTYAVAGNFVGRMYILLGGDYTGATRAGTFFQKSVPIESGTDRKGFYFVGDNAGGVLRLGTAFASVGTFDNAAGTDLVVSATGNSNGTPPGRIFFASGRAYVGPGIVELPVTELGFRDAQTAMPSGMPITVGGTRFGTNVVALGNGYNVPGANKPNVVDIGVYLAGDTGYTLFPGDTNFAPADSVFVAAASGSATFFGSSICAGQDLDGDGLAEQCAGGSRDLINSAQPGTAYLWYGDNLSAQVSSKVVNTDAATLLDVPPQGTVDPTPGFVAAGARVIEFVGDLNADGKVDMVEATPSSNNSAGELTILY